MPTDELFDHLGSIGVSEDIPITCSERIYLDFYPTEELESAFSENDVCGAANMDKAYENLREELLGQSGELKM
jgi:hypothetical protein